MGKGGHNFPDAESLWGHRITAGAAQWLGAPRRKVTKMSQALSSIHHICFQKTSGSNVGTPNLLLAPCAISPRYAMGAVGLTTNHKPTLPSHKSLMGINFRYMPHEIAKIYLKIIYAIEAHYITRQIFSVFVE